MNIAFGMIVFNGNYVLQECLEAVYPHASQIIIAEGPVKYWQDRGYTTSDDGTNDILNEFYDPDEKISVVHRKYLEKDEQCNAYIQFMRDDTDYLWNLDSDEVFKDEDIVCVKNLLKQLSLTSVGFKSLSFYGGFDRYLTGFEEDAEFLRIHKIYPGSYWHTHRPPRIAHKQSPLLQSKHLNHNTLATLGVRMYHYSYVFPQQVKQKVAYYTAAVGDKDVQIPNYFNDVYLPWLQGKREEIEQKYEGVHEWKPSYRGPCYTTPFTGNHPTIIQQNLNKLQKKFDEQLQLATR
jgi:hypothetical protein